MLSKVFSILLTFFLCLFFLSAQERSKADILFMNYDQQADIIQSDILLNVLQEGDYNFINLFQNQNDLPSVSAVVEQYGNFNISKVKQIGSAHSTILMQQGTGNSANLYSYRKSTRMYIRQEGNFNFINSNIVNNAQQPHSAILHQNGDNNLIDVTIAGINLQKEERIVAVYQTGNDLSFTGFFDSLVHPVKVQQKSGDSGEGMKVSIIKSDFYLPLN